MALFTYTGLKMRAYPQLGLVANPGDVVDYGATPVANDGRWTPAPVGAIPTKTVQVGAPGYTLPGAPLAGQALTWDAALQQYVPTDLSATYASKPTNAGTTGQAIVKQADGTLAFATISGGSAGIGTDTDGVPYLTS